VEESSVRSRLYCNCGDDARDLPNPVALPLLSLLPGTAQRYWLGVAFSLLEPRAYGEVSRLYPVGLHFVS
jgi:hypothetical protein